MFNVPVKVRRCIATAMNDEILHRWINAKADATVHIPDELISLAFIRVVSKPSTTPEVLHIIISLLQYRRDLPRRQQQNLGCSSHRLLIHLVKIWNIGIVPASFFLESSPHTFTIRRSNIHRVISRQQLGQIAWKSSEKGHIHRANQLFLVEVDRCRNLELGFFICLKLRVSMDQEMGGLNRAINRASFNVAYDQYSTPRIWFETPLCALSMPALTTRHPRQNSYCKSRVLFFLNELILTKRAADGRL